MTHAVVPHLLAWARITRRPVTFIQLAATAQVPHVVWFGVFDLGHVTLFPNGRIETRSVYVNPDCRISSETAQLAGICDADVAHLPSWAAWAPILHLMAQDHVMVGFDSHVFGCEVIQRQNERYGVPGTTFLRALDARSLPGVFGTLLQAAAHFGLQRRPPRRAFEAAWLTAGLVEAVAARHGLEALDACMDSWPSGAPQSAPLQHGGHEDTAI